MQGICKDARLRGIRRRKCTSGRYTSGRCTSARSSLPVNVYEIYGGILIFENSFVVSDAEPGLAVMSGSAAACGPNEPTYYLAVPPAPVYPSALDDGTHLRSRVPPFVRLHSNVPEAPNWALRDCQTAGSSRPSSPPPSNAQRLIHVSQQRMHSFGPDVRYPR